MERLTIEYDGQFVPSKLCRIDRLGRADYYDGCADDCNGECKSCAVQECFTMLAHYENNGLTPEDCMNYKTFEDEVIARGKSFNHILELLKAEEQGMLIKLPCKAGDIIWLDTPTGIQYQTVIDIVVDTEGTYIETKRFYISIKDLGKEFFLSKEAAEEALKES